MCFHSTKQIRVLFCEVIVSKANNSIRTAKLHKAYQQNTVCGDKIARTYSSHRKQDKKEFESQQNIPTIFESAVICRCHCAPCKT